jgi:hypothetical protein
MQTTLIGSFVARDIVSELATSALPGAPVVREADRRPLKRLLHRA